MKTVINIALRNLSRQKKRTILLGSAIAFGIMIVTLINGFAGSFSTNVAENFADLMAGHIFIQGIEKDEKGKEVSIIRDDSIISKAIEESGTSLKYITKRSSFAGTLIFGGKKISTNINGADLSHEKFLSDRLVLKEGSWSNMSEREGIILSDKIAEKLNVTIGDQILVKLETITGQANVGEFILAGISFDTGLVGQIMSYANLSYVNELIGLAEDEYQQIGIMLDTLKATNVSADLIYSKISPNVAMFPRGENLKAGEENPLQRMTRQMKEEDWQGTRYALFTITEALSVIDTIVVALDNTSTVILVVLFIIIMVGITNTFSMVMFERIGEIGTMRAIGVQKKGVRQMFLWEALFLALMGAIAGIILALIIMSFVSLINFGMDTPAFMIMNNGHLSFHLPPERAILNIVIIAILTLLAALGPANKAAKLLPAEALRTHK